MRILLSNDDGYRAPGITALAGVLRRIGEVIVVAPERNRSGASNSLTLDQPLRLVQVEASVYWVDGTPADCIHVAVSELFGGMPDMVVSGINAGENLGEDVLYSGTVAAAMEGSMLGCPAIAVSLASRECTHYASAAEVTFNVVKRIADRGMPKNWLLNINVPDLTLAQLRGIRVTRLGQRHKGATTVQQTDPKGRPMFWIGPSGPPGADAGPGTDFHAIENDFVSLTPLQTDLTAYGVMEELADWLEA